MSALATLTGRLTLPYQRGAEFLAIPLGADSGSTTLIASYDFSDYRARWGQDPAQPTYVIAPQMDVTGDDIVVTVSYNFRGSQTATLTIASGTRAGTTFPLPLPFNADASLRLIQLTVTPALGVAGQLAWEVTALLGTTAKLLWILSAEKDAITRVRQDVQRARFVATALGAGLDAMGEDMRVPRFPPRPYSIDDATIALWHLDELPGSGPVTTVADQATPSHPGTVAGAVPGAPGKYGTGFGFVATGSAITVAASSDFDIAATANVTVEAFAAVQIPSDTTPRVIIARRSAETATASTNPGWSLSVINCRGFNANVMFALCDGTREVRLFGDLCIADRKYHHIAGIIDRGRSRARLYVDGIQRATAAIDGLGAIAPAAGVSFGATAGGNNLTGSIDEARVSRVARTTFHPALGEDDEAYRARLRIFRRWVLPAPAQIISMINEVAPLPTDPAPYFLVETNRPTQVALRTVRIFPPTLPAGTAIAADGTTVRDESVAGTAADDAGFDPALDLITYSNTAVDSSSDPGGGKMQAGTARLLDFLVARLASAGIQGNLILEHSYDPSGPTPLHTVGRALRLRHATLDVPTLGSLAHRSNFAYVSNLGPDIAVAVPAGERLAIRSVPLAGERADLGSAFDLTIDPPVPLAGNFSWTVVSPGPAKAHLVSHSADPTTLATPVAGRPRVRLVTDAPGDIAVRIEYERNGRTRSGTLSIRIDPTTLADGHAIDVLGNVDPNLTSISGPPDPGFTPAYLVTHATSTAIDFGTAPNNATMQVVTRDALDNLVALLAARKTTGRLQVKQAYIATGTGADGVGRELLLGHETLDPGVLGALASRYFDYVARSGTTVTAIMRPDSLIAIGASGTSAPISCEIPTGIAVALAPVPPALPAGAYSWSTQQIGNGAGSFDSVVTASANFTPTTPGQLTLALTFVATDSTRAAPYTFEVRLKPALDVPATVIPKAQYDIIMNVLDAFHPIGIEVLTDRIRAHVREVEQDPTKAFPAYSFINFRS